MARHGGQCGHAGEKGRGMFSYFSLLEKENPNHVRDKV
jgi:hypothetical protein